jgi:hypothetical protein
MAVYKRGGVYWYEFLFKGERVRESTHQGNQNTARTEAGTPTFQPGHGHGSGFGKPRAGHSEAYVAACP